jgi:ADP-heptose:LPS heptosyltransferase
MGDVVLALPALKAIRRKFPASKMTALVGKTGATVARLAGVFDDEIVVDRVELRDGKRLGSINKIRLLVKEVRRRKFDFIIDLHSLSETNLLGFLSGTRARLYANRENRSLDFLAKFPEKPPREDKTKHFTERYLDVLKPLGIENVSHYAKIEPPGDDLAEMKKRFRDLGLEGKRLVGLFPGAGHPNRRWGVKKFAALAKSLEATDDCCVLVFLGPEETDLLDEIKREFPKNAIILNKLTIFQLVAALSLLNVFVSNDTGPMHLAAVAGADVVMISDERAPTCFYPLAEKLEVVRIRKLHELTVEDVLEATLKLLNE